MNEELISKRVIRRLNKEIDKSYLWCGDDYPSKFNTYDVLSIQIQSMYMDEINPLLEDCINGIIEYECECERKGTDPEEVYKVFRKMLDDHYYIKKIQNYIDRW